MAHSPLQQAPSLTPGVVPPPDGPGRIRLRSLAHPFLAPGRTFTMAVWLVLLGRLANGATGAEPAISYNREVRSVLSEHCFACHGPDEKARKAGLRLDRETDARKALKSGKAALVPGQLEASELWHRITTENADDRMPPAEMKKPLSSANVELLRRWIEQGAPFEGHWAYLPPKRVDPPAVRATNWVRSDLDRFVLARLEREGVVPSPEAPREKWLRRVSLDLTGLPPTVEEIDGFLADPEAGAEAKVVDRLLASPHYGERMAQQWLDLARYGETQGYHHDRHRDLWRWREWVIRAFNRNQPFDEFTVDQLAGDLLPNPSRDQLVATGFHRNEMTTSEGGALPEEYIVKYAVGRVDTTARVWLGTSMACAECHDHKYDPISTRDYYRFFAFFYDTPENGLDREELNPVPRITLESPEQRARAEQLDREAAALETAFALLTETPRPAWDDAETAWSTRHRRESVEGWTPLTPVAARARATELSIGAEGRVTLDPARGSNAVYELEFDTQARGLTGFRIEALPEEHGTNRRGPGLGQDGKFRLAQLEAEVESLDPAAERWPGEGVKSGPWQAVGPFQASSAKEAYEKEFGPEKNSDPAALFGDGSLAWKAAPAGSETDRVPVSAGEGATYVTRTWTVSESCFADLQLRTPGGVRVWVNGKPVHARPGARGKNEGPERVRIGLRAGENKVLLKLVQSAEAAFAEVRLDGSPATTATLVLERAAGTGTPGAQAPRLAIDGNLETSWAPNPTNHVELSAAFAVRDTFGFQSGTRIRLRLIFDGRQGEARLRSFRVQASSGSGLSEYLDYPDAVRAALAQAPESRSEAARKELRGYYRQRFVPEVSGAQQVLAAKRKERDGERQSWATAMVMQQATPARETQMRLRGQYNQLGDKVDPGVPEAILPWKEGLPRNRLGLARWLVDPANPLTSRVVVNHYWQRLFGTGLVKTSEEFGAQGEWPSHPELLDWLAEEFVRTGWDVKAFHRRVVLSATYRQDSVVGPERLERDPENRLLARGARFRLDAENIRDVAMSASGLLNPKVGGPSVFPYQPPGLWAQVSFEGTSDYQQSEGAENYRRGLYTYWRRSIPYASFTVFDAPSREVCTVRRPRTNTPLQALALLNDPVYVEAARALAQRVLTRGGNTFESRLEYAFRVVVGRKPTRNEQGVLAAACERETKRFSADRESANRLIHVGASRPPVEVDIAELAAWTMLANTLLNLDEAVTKG
ncbi:MAG: PSD1 domain-containing protein [Verrucomicrobiales bacterium]|nr:PSD1 domain-containing protein [Verrucomicrobiales bacterium]